MRLASVFCEGAVLQRGKPICVWGEEKSGSLVTVKLNGNCTETVVENGRWRAYLPATEAAVGLTLEVANDLGEMVKVTDIAVGEVWIAGGQSNMEFLMKWDAEREAVLNTYQNPILRFYEVPKLSYDGQEVDEDHSHEGIWRKAVPDELAWFSAVGFYFARKVQSFLGEVPIGIIGCNWGGTSASCWMTDGYLDGKLAWYIAQREATKALDLDKEFATFKKTQAMHNNPEAKANMDRMMATPITTPVKLLPPEERDRFMRTKYALFSQFRAAGLYETMLSKIIPYTAAGVIWYQGEEDAAKADVYAHLLGNMIQCWRDSWHDELPFIVAQLTAYANPEEMQLDFTDIRAVQEYVAKTVPNTHLVCTMDVGLPYDIHPKRKRPVGERMALQAITKVYGGDVVCDSPEVAGAWKAPGKVVLQMLHCGDGLYIKGEAAEGFTLTVNGKTQTNMCVTANGDKLVISCEAVAVDSRVLISYAQKDYCEVNLYSSENLPVRPFVVQL